jgi:CDP-diacylglycerol--glycerol-3-phosphate 3-phosphatidyltransferase
VLIYLIFKGQQDLFKWLLFVSFFTDAIDGTLARLYQVTSLLGSKLDSIGDDLTIAAAITGMFVFKLQFIKDEIVIVSVLLSLYVLQNIIAIVRYRKVTSFHTYLAKLATLFQGVFLILIFFLPAPVYALFYVASVITILDLAEEIILLFILPDWEANVKGIYWVLKRKREERLNKSK